MDVNVSYMSKPEIAAMCAATPTVKSPPAFVGVVGVMAVLFTRESVLGE